MAASLPFEFASTRWSLVLRAGAAADGASRAALEELCQIYWPPVYAFLRTDGKSPHDAEDITQGFFLELLRRGDLQHVRPHRGRFRSFLLAALKNYLANERRHSRALKRGGDQTIVSLDTDAVEGDLRSEPAHSWTPERAFDRQWALTLLDRVRQLLAAEFAAARKAEQFQRLAPFLASEPPAAAYAELAREWGTSEGAVKVAIHRIRRKFRDRLRQEIAHTVQSPDEIDDEIRRLFAALGGR